MDSDGKAAERGKRNTARVMAVDEKYEAAVAERRDQIMGKVKDALARVGRRADEAQVMAVSKTVGTDEVLAAMRAGYRLFGENRPQELVRKLDALGARADEVPGPYSFDMIGNLQTNKINMTIGRAARIHSVRSEKLARAVSDRVVRAHEAGGSVEVQPVLLEVNVSGEESKSGFAPDELRRDFDALLALPGIRIEGLMTMAPQGDAARARATFAGLRELRDELSLSAGVELHELSMGMSEDFEAALEEGSTLVRLGRVVFNPGFVLQ